MAGQMGNERVTVLNLEVVSSDPERNLLLLRGAVPGAAGSLVMVRSSVKSGETSGRHH
jgi:large subunit ribosomal protein L3